MTPMRSGGSCARASRPPKPATAKVAAEAFRSARRDVFINSSLGRPAVRPFVSLVRRQYFARLRLSQRAALILPPFRAFQGLLRYLEKFGQLRFRERRLEEFERDR